MRLHRDDFEMLKVIGRGAFGEVRNSVNPCCFFGMFYSAGKSPLNHCSLCHIIVFSPFLSFVFMTHFVCPTKTPKLSVKYSCPPQASYQQPQTQTPSSQLSFPPLPLPIPQGSRPGVGLLFLGRHKSRHFIQIVCFTGECATRSCTKTLGLFTTRTVHFSFLFLYQSVFHHCFSPTFSSCSTQLN